MGYHAFGQQSGAWGPDTDPQAIPRFAFAGQYTALESFALKANEKAGDRLVVDLYDQSTTTAKPAVKKTAQQGSKRDIINHIAAERGQFKAV